MLEDIVLSIIGLGFAFLLFAGTTMFCWCMYEDIQFKKEDMALTQFELRKELCKDALDNPKYTRSFAVLWKNKGD